MAHQKTTSSPDAPVTDSPLTESPAAATPTTGSPAADTTPTAAAPDPDDDVYTSAKPLPVPPAPASPSTRSTSSADPRPAPPRTPPPRPGPPRPQPPKPEPPRPAPPAAPRQLTERATASADQPDDQADMSAGNVVDDPATSSAVKVPPPATAVVHPVPPAGPHPERWGRVDADGTVYLRTEDGERAVGSWQAGAPAEGLAHFARRFDDLLTEAELLAARLAGGGAAPKHTATSARHLRESLAEASVVGDVAGLAVHLDALVERAEEAVRGARSARDALRVKAVARKEELAAEAEKLAEATAQWKQAGDRFKSILEEWRTIRGIDRKTDELLWKRFSRARDGFNRRRGSHFVELDRQRAAARARKEELAVEAEQLSESTDWGPTTARYKQLMADWKAAGRAQKDADDALWQRFRAAQETFFSRRSSVLSERDAEFAANADRKEQLLAEAERIDTANPEAARAALRSVHERWTDSGKVPRGRIRELEDRLRAVEDRIRSELEQRWRRSDPEVDARVAQFRERVAQYESQAEKARAAGDTRRAQEAEGQAEQWREWLATAEKAVQR